MWRKSNNLVGFINFITFLLSIPILGGGIWLSSKANQTDCMKFLQWPLIIIGAIIMVVSLMGFAGSCYRITWLLWLYLFVMFFVIAALFALIIFSYSVTSKGSGHQVLNRVYLDYSLSDYSGWLKDRVSDDSYWMKISSCIRDAKVCRKLGVSAGGLSEAADTFYRRHLSPIQAARGSGEATGVGAEAPRKLLTWHLAQENAKRAAFGWSSRPEDRPTI